MEDDFYFSQTTLARRYGRTTRTIQRWRDTGKLPKPVPLPGGGEGWHNRVIEALERSLVGSAEAPAS